LRSGRPEKITVAAQGATGKSFSKTAFASTYFFLPVIPAMNCRLGGAENFPVPVRSGLPASAKPVVLLKFGAGPGRQNCDESCKITRGHPSERGNVRSAVIQQE
jgi:hypothetical protein